MKIYEEKILKFVKIENGTKFHKIYISPFHEKESLSAHQNPKSFLSHNVGEKFLIMKIKFNC